MRRQTYYLCLVIGFFAATSIVVGQAANEPKPRIEYKFGPERQVGLTLLDEQGNPISLMFSGDGDTNSTVLRIDGRDVEFGTEDGKWDGDPKPLAKGKDGKPRHGHQSTWVYESIAITQIVEIVPSKTGRLDACVIRYEIENKDNKAREVGIRVVIDTMINENDGHPFVIPGKKELITTCGDFRAGKGFPDAVQAVENEDLTQPGVVAHFSLKVGGGLDAPDRLVITRLPEEFDAWDVPVQNIDGDAAVGLFWNPRRLQAGARRGVGYGYGQSVVSLGEAKRK